MDAVASVRRRRNFTLLSRSVGIGSSELSKLIAIDERVSCFWNYIFTLLHNWHTTKCATQISTVNPKCTYVHLASRAAVVLSKCYFLNIIPFGRGLPPTVLLPRHSRRRCWAQRLREEVAAHFESGLTFRTCASLPSLLPGCSGVRGWTPPPGSRLSEGFAWCTDLHLVRSDFVEHEQTFEKRFLEQLFCFPS